MHNTFITAGAIAMAIALNSVATFAAAPQSPHPTNSWQQGTKIEGKLVLLQDYLDQGDHNASMGTHNTSPARTHSDPSTAGTPAAFDNQPNTSRTAGTRDSADEQRKRLVDTSGAATHRSNPEVTESSNNKTLVLIASSFTVQNPPSGTSRTSLGQVTGGQSRGDQERRTASGPNAESAKAYILVFEDDELGQASCAKAHGMITADKSQWSSSHAEATDRQQVRGKDNTDTSERQQVAPKQHPSTNALTNTAGQKSSSIQGSQSGSHVTITGKVISRGGIQAIQVSEISQGNMPTTSNQPTPTNDTSERSNRDTQNTR